MKIQITMDQPSIEQAIKDYVAKNGIDSTVQEVRFTVTRKGGTSIDAEVILGNEAVNTPPTVAPDEPQPATKPKPVKAEVTKQAGPETTKAPEPVKEEDEPPFEPDEKAEAVNDSTATEPKNSKSLFG